MTPSERKQRRAENLRKPRTVMANAFLEALHKWVRRHASDDNTAITLPVGTVTTAELVQVITALIAARRVS